MIVAAGCGSIDRSALDPLRGDAEVVADAGIVSPGSDAGLAPMDVAAARDAGNPPTDTGAPLMVVDVGTDPVDTGPVIVDSGPPPRDVGPADPCAVNTACGTCTPRNGCGWCIDLGVCASGASSGPTGGQCARANWAWQQRDCPTTPPVDAGSPVDVGPVGPPDACHACAAFAPVTFCAGSGACLPYDGCGTDNCSVCAAPATGGDNCASPPVVVNQSGHHRAVFTTCGLADNIDTNCGTAGPDMVIAVTVARAGRVTVVLTSPPGVAMSLGYDVTFASQTCADSRAGRTCNGNTSSNSQTIDITLPAGTYFLYVATTQPATVVVDSTLP